MNQDQQRRCSARIRALPEVHYGPPTIVYAVFDIVDRTPLAPHLYRVKWAGYKNESDDTWEAGAELEEKFAPLLRFVDAFKNWQEGEHHATFGQFKHCFKVSSCI